MSDPYRPPIPTAPQVRGYIDPIEKAAAEAIEQLRSDYCWTVRRASSDDVRNIEVGFGEAVAKIIDSVRRLREQKAA